MLVQLQCEVFSLGLQWHQSSTADLWKRETATWAHSCFQPRCSVAATERELLQHRADSALFNSEKGSPDPGSVQGQAGQSLEEPGLVRSVPALGRGGWD